MAIVGGGAGVCASAAAQVIEGAPRPKKPIFAPPLGLGVVALEPDAARGLGVDAGLEVYRATGTAYVSGVRVGDVIVAIGGQPVSTVTAFWDAVEAARWQPTLQVLRGGKTLTIRVADESTPR